MIAVYMPTARFNDAMRTRALSLTRAAARELEGMQAVAGAA